jgi:alpha-amylase
MMQASYWDCPRLEQREHQWWDYLRGELPGLQAAGFTALWLPPVHKAASWDSMGYDPYDFYDLGEYDQKGGVPNWFGTRAQLEALIQAAHGARLQVYADLVLNHNSGADAEETNPLDGSRRWTQFTPRSNRFPRDWPCFHPSPYETWDGETFGGMPDLCHRHPRVYSELIDYGRWLLETVGFDGFRYDCVKGYGGWMIRSLQELRALRGGQVFKPFGVGECWSGTRRIVDWLDETNAWSDNPATAFDFELRWRFRDLCDTYGYSLRALVAPGTLLSERPTQAVTFVENHDVVRQAPIVQDKILAYAFILTHEGYPCVFWQDYFNWKLAAPGRPDGIDALIKAHERYAGGSTRTLYLDDDLYVMQRDGHEAMPGLLFVLNNRPEWNGCWVQSRWTQTRLTPVAWRGRNDPGTPLDQWADDTGWVNVWAPPRGYSVYVPGGVNT